MQVKSRLFPFRQEAVLFFVFKKAVHIINSNGILQEFPRMNFLKVMPQNLKFNALITTDPLIVENTQGGDEEL